MSNQQSTASGHRPKRSVLATAAAVVIALAVWLLGGDPMAVFNRLLPTDVQTQSTAVSSVSVSQTASEGKLEVWYVDVGQGDCELIRFPDGETMLIDAGERSYNTAVIDFIHAQGIQKLNTVIATHPHTDHIGAMAEVLKAIPTDTLYLPDRDATSAGYRKMLEAAEETNVQVKTAEAGIILKQTDALCAKLIAPVTITEETDTNSVSAVLKRTYGKTKLLFMGDAETDEEATITEEVQADIIKIGHHGSTTSSGKKFVQAVQAKVGIISCGAGNDYGHPHDEIVARWEAIGTKLWRTDSVGTVYVQADGQTYTVAAWEESK